MNVTNAPTINTGTSSVFSDTLLIITAVGTIVNGLMHAFGLSKPDMSNQVASNISPLMLELKIKMIINFIFIISVSPRLRTMI